MANQFREAVTNEERKRGKKPSRFSAPPESVGVEPQMNLRRRNIAVAAQADRDRAAAQQRAQAATQNRPADVRGLQRRAVPGRTRAIKTEPTPSGGRVALGADAQRRIGFDAGTTRDIIAQRQQAEVDAQAAQQAEQAAARERFRGSNPESKLLSDADIDRAMQVEQRVGDIRQQIGAIDPNDPLAGETEFKLAQRRDRLERFGQNLRDKPATPQVSASNQANAAAIGSQARDLDKQIAALEAAGGDNPPDNVRQRLTEMRAEREMLRGEAAIEGTQAGDSEVTKARKAQTTPRKQINAIVGQGEELFEKGVDKVKAKGPEAAAAVRDFADKAVEKGKQAVSDLQSSEIPGETPDADAPKTTGERLKQKVGETKEAFDERVKKFQEDRAARKEARAEKKGRSKRVAGGGLRTGGFAALPGVVGEVFSNIQEEGGVIPGLTRTGSEALEGLEDTALTAARTVEQRGLRSGVDLLQGIGEGILEGADATGRAVVAGLTSPFVPETFSDIYRGMEGRTPLGQVAARSVEDRERRLASPGGGGVIAETPADDPAALQTQPAQPTDAPPTLAGTARTGVEGTGFAPVEAEGVDRLEGPRGSFIEGNRVGGGNFNVLQGPGGPGASVADNVAAYDRQTAALRGLRNAQRAATGDAPVGQRTHEGFAQTGFGERQRLKNLERGKPEYDDRLTPRQNQARLDNWVEGVRQENIARGINPNTGLDTNEAQATAQGRNAIAAANLQRLSANDAFQQSIKGLELAMKDREFGRQLQKDERDFMNTTQKFLSSDNPAEQAQGLNNLIQAYGADPGSPTGQLALQTLGQMFPEAAGDERGLINFVQGLLMGGEYRAVAPTLDPNQAQQFVNRGETGSNLLFGSRVGTPGNNYFYRADDPRAFDLFQGLRGQNRQR